MRAPSLHPVCAAQVHHPLFGLVELVADLEYRRHQTTLTAWWQRSSALGALYGVAVMAVMSVVAVLVSFVGGYPAM